MLLEIDVSMLVAITFAPATTAPEVSVTVPTRAPWFCVCAHAKHASSNISSASVTLFICDPLILPSAPTGSDTTTVDRGRFYCPPCGGCQGEFRFNLK